MFPNVCHLILLNLNQIVALPEFKMQNNREVAAEKPPFFAIGSSLKQNAFPTFSKSEMELKVITGLRGPCSLPPLAFPFIINST